MKRLFHKSRGFTLVELMVVMTIMAIMAAIVVPAVGGVTTTGRGSVKTADVKTVQNALERFVGDNPKGQAFGWPTATGAPAPTGTTVPLNWGASFVDPKDGSIKSFAKDYLKLSVAPTGTITTSETVAPTGSITVVVTMPHSGAVRTADALSGTLTDGQLRYVITAAGLKPNIVPSIAPSTVPDTGWAATDVTGLSPVYPVWRLDGGGTVKLNLSDSEY